ncbi:signal peptidase II [Pseudalkalibacillus caeni]|uniref:Lipoprotein signal peptidase n=1 Tax=Exobacillus caeni TaxID=2574798 RepID=A0A5R9F641_9BACL|nr:signal peptidase II [Pseudalkalibacillus caeni]TLS35275.1 lipoprotein signal peptidase [Pseudalkalibacillus caeni]
MWKYLIALLVIIVDQWTKWLVVKNMELGERITVIQDFLYLTSHRNRGAAWGILQGQMWFFYIITIVVVIAILYYMRQYRTNRFISFVLALILGGAAGNFIDRIWRGEVVDFVDTYIFSYDYPIFNVADSALVVGVVLIIIASLFEGKKAEGES